MNFLYILLTINGALLLQNILTFYIARRALRAARAFKEAPVLTDETIRAGMKKIEEAATNNPFPMMPMPGMPPGLQQMLYHSLNGLPEVQRLYSFKKFKDAYPMTNATAKEDRRHLLEMERELMEKAKEAVDRAQMPSSFMSI